MRTLLPRWFLLLLFFCLSVGVTAGSARALEPPITVAPIAKQTAPLPAAATDGILGNRSRMVQVTFIAFAIGVAILVTATRKH